MTVGQWRSKVLSQMVEILRERKPKSFVSDLLWDGVWLGEQSAPVDFYWVVYYSGTHLFRDKKNSEKLVDTIHRDYPRQAYSVSFDSEGNMTEYKNDWQI